MKNLIKLFLGTMMLAGTFLSCEKDENKIYLESALAPTLTANREGIIPLSFLNEASEAIALDWTNPEYKFTTGVSSQDVTYLLEIDTTGANFTNPKRKQLSIAKSLSISFKQSEINDFLLNQLELAAAMPHEVEIRVKASLAGSANTEFLSNVLKFTATPYTIPPKVTPPASGTLYITGSATARSWMAGGDPEVLSQKFTQINPTFYELTVDLIGGGSYTFVPVYGDWGIKYSIKIKNDPNSVNGGDFQVGGEDILAPAASGSYKIQVDFQRGKFTVTKQ